MKDNKGRFVKGSLPIAGFKKGNVPWMSGRNHTTESKLKMSLAKKGRHLSPNTEFKKGHVMSEETKRKIGIKSSGRTHSDWSKKKISKANRGSGNGNYGKFWDKNPNFSTGIGAYIQQFVRNGGKPLCEQCGKKGRFAINSIHVHHKDGNRHNNILDNLQSLCSRCHLNKHKNWEKG